MLMEKWRTSWARASTYVARGATGTPPCRSEPKSSSSGSRATSRTSKPGWKWRSDCREKERCAMWDAVLCILIIGGFFVFRAVLATVFFYYLLPEGDRCPNCDAATLRVQSRGWNVLM